MKDFVKKILEMDEYQLWEMTTTANGGGGYDTPNAFASSEEDHLKHIDGALKSAGFNKKAKNEKNNTVKENKSMKEQSEYVKLAAVINGLDSILNEITYKDFKKDERPTVRKIGESIKEINRTLFEIEKAVGRAAKLKMETNTQNKALWKASVTRLGKMSERLRRIESRIRELGS